MKVLMCRPDYFDVRYVINPWMKKGIQNPPDKTQTLKQWQNLKDTYESFGIKCHVIEQAEKFPDMVFTANAGLIIDEATVLLSRFRHKERRGEIAHFAKKFRSLGFKILYLSDGAYFEGHGDALFYGDNQIIFGYSDHSWSRSDIKGVHIASNYIPNKTPTFMQLVNSHFYHLDTCFCPIGEVIMYYPQAFSSVGQKTLKCLSQGKFIEVSKEDAENFVCNAVPIQTAAGWVLISNKMTKALKDELREWEIRVIEKDVSEFLKAGGAQRCLTLFI